MMPRICFAIFLIQPIWAQELGVILFEHSEFQGRYEVFATDDSDLSDNTIGFQQASSVRVPPGWTAILFSDRDFQGASMTLTGDEPRLSKTDFGNDRVASIRVRGASGRGMPSARGIVLFDQPRFKGRSETLVADRANLKDSIVGNDRLRSLRVPRGAKVTCFKDKDFEGDGEVFLFDDGDLSDNPIGADSVSSIKIDFGDPDVLELTSKGVILFEHENFKGKRDPFFDDDPNLEDNLIGLNNASSIKVPEGLVLELFGKPEFKGKSVKLRGDLWDLGQTKLGNDNSGSLRIGIEPSRVRGMQAQRTRTELPTRSSNSEVIGQTREKPKERKPKKAVAKPKKEASVTETPPGDDVTVAIILFSEMYFGGVREELAASDGDLSDNAISMEGVGSIQVLAGYKVTLFDQPNFQGQSETLTFDDADMSDNAVGGQSLASIKIEKLSY